MRRLRCKTDKAAAPLNRKKIKDPDTYVTPSLYLIRKIPIMTWQLVKAFDRNCEKVPQLCRHFETGGKNNIHIHRSLYPCIKYVDLTFCDLVKACGRNREIYRHTNRQTSERSSKK